MSAPAPITVTPILVADLLVEGEPMPLYVHVIDHPDARVLVDTGMTELPPFAAPSIPACGLPGLRLLPAPGHTRGIQVIVVETGGRPVVVGGDVAVWHGELDEPPTEGRLRVLALDPELVRLAREHEP